MRNPTRISCGITTLALFAVAATAETHTGIELCRQSTSQAAQIACLESLVNHLALGEEPPTGPTQGPATSTADADLTRPTDSAGATPTVPLAVEAIAAGSAATVTPTRAAPPVAEEIASTIRSEQNGAANDSSGQGTIVPATAPLPNEAAVENTSSSDSEPDERADDERGDKSARIRATAVSFKFVGRNKLRVELDNGQVWRQNNSDRPNLYPSLRRLETFDVEMWQTWQDTYRMHIPAASRTIRVERLR